MTILRIRLLLEANDLGPQIPSTVDATLASKDLMVKSGTAADPTLIAAPCSTKSNAGERDPEMHQSKKGNEWRV